MEQIKIPQTSLPPKEILLEDRGQTITLLSSCMLVQSCGKWDITKEEDDTMRTNSFFDNTYILDKNGTWAMEMYYHNKSMRYILDLATARIVFGKDGESPKLAKERCKELFDKIANWKYSITLP